ncbi:hypothetical protein AB0B31_11075 [Catellatospora citrea]|uniref:hypothetical protein n=1 Tax=Catellatospora citrea TaxID=53366 RepID=UPI0033E21191
MPRILQQAKTATRARCLDTDFGSTTDALHLSVLAVIDGLFPRINITRDIKINRPEAHVDVLTPERTWFRLLDNTASAWWHDTTAIPAQARQLEPVAAALIVRAHTVPSAIS